MKTGRVILDGIARFGNGRTDRSRDAGRRLQREGGIRAIVVPAGLKVGERLYGIGKVVDARRDRVTVAYKQGQARATAIYDRHTGWLLQMVVGDPRRPAATLTRVTSG